MAFLNKRDYHRRVLGQTVRDLRNAQDPKWTQEKLARKLGCDVRHIIRIESGKVPATLELIGELAEAFNEPVLNLAFSLFPGPITSSTHAELSLQVDKHLTRLWEDFTNRSKERLQLREAFEAMINLDNEQLETIKNVAMALSHYQTCELAGKQLIPPPIPGSRITSVNTTVVEKKR